MRLATIQTNLGARAALLQDGVYFDLHGTDSDFPASLRQLLEQGPAAMRAVEQVTRREKAVEYPANEVHLLPPIPDPQKIICLGRNYSEHAKESGSEIPKEPVLFSKYPTALVGHGQAIVLPAVSKEVDFEAELVVVIGKRGRSFSADEAMSHVAGYTMGNDVSARDWQLKKDGKQWMAGKTFDTFAPTGPILVTTVEVPDPHHLFIRLRLNGKTMQDSNTSDMIFPISTVLAYISQIVTLMPGDLVFTGTPPGVGFVRKPPVFLQPGDTVEVEIDRLGVLRNPVV
jgi:2-keto-4-pentenoate hydratase/2-oxohepta-3-ene-1,7-dioic acid hydratase in catechol pathway